MNHGSWSKPAIGPLGKPLLKTPSWGGLPVEMLVIPANERRGHRVFREPTIQLAVTGRGQRVYCCGRQRRKLATAPHMFEFYGAGFEVDEAEWNGDEDGVCISVRFAPGTPCLHQCPELEHLSFATRHEVFDPRLQHLVEALSAEATEGGSSGALYAQGLSVAIGGYVLQYYGNACAPANPRLHGFSSSQKRRLIEFIEAMCHTNLSIERLAGSLEMSAYQFTRRFRRCFGVTPHQYVLQQRICLAEQMLRAHPDMPIVQVALLHGFSAHAHFTDAFRRFTGRTPTAARFS